VIAVKAVVHGPTAGGRRHGAEREAVVAPRVPARGVERDLKRATYLDAPSEPGMPTQRRWEG